MQLSTRILLALFVAALPVAAAAKPLTAEQCAALKTERDKLASSGLREALAQPAPTQVQRTLDDRGRQMRSLIDIEGQLRFRCAIDLPIPTLKPELLVELPDRVEGEAAATPDVKTPVKRKAKPAAKPASEGSAEAAAAPAAPRAPRKQKAAAANEGSATATDGEPPAQSARKAKPRPKVEDAFKPPAGSSGESNGPDATGGKSE